MADTDVKEVRGKTKSKISNGMKTRVTASIPFHEPEKEAKNMKSKNRNNKNEYDKKITLSREMTDEMRNDIKDNFKVKYDIT